MANLIELRGATAGYERDRPVFSSVHMVLASGDFVSLIGPNGSGKSTLIRCLAGVLPLWEGDLQYEGKSASSMDRRSVARFVGVVPQIDYSAFSFSVRELIAMGRHPYLRPLRGLDPNDWQAVHRAMQLADVESFAHRSMAELSGGERQRVIIARALAQTPRVLLLDEPSNHLDINHQIEIFDLLHRLNCEEGLTLLCSMHDLNLAAEYCQRILVMEGGTLCAEGATHEVMQSDVLSRVYRMPIRVDRRDDGLLHIIPLSQKRRTLSQE